MTSFVQTLVASAPTIATVAGGSSNYVVETNAGVQYLVYIDSAQDVVFKKSTDGGKTWSGSTVIYAGTTMSQLSVWFDKWSGLAGGLIHCAYCDGGSADDVLYRSIDTANSDTLGTQTVIFAGASAVAGLGLSITRTRGGNIICVGTIDNGTENFAKKSTDVGGTWGNIAAVMESGAGDQVIMAPGFASDNQDAMCFFWDSSASEVSVKFYDDSADSWAETVLGTSMTALAPSTAYPNFSIAVDLTATYVILAAWSATDLANADLRLWVVNETAQTEKTNVVLNSVDDQGLCAVSLDTASGDIYVFYYGASGGGETFPSQVRIYYKVSADDGATWGSETLLAPSIMTANFLITNPRMVYLANELVVGCIPGPSQFDLNFISIAPALPTAAQVQSGVTFGINGTEFTGTLSSGSGGVMVNPGLSGGLR